MGQADKKSLRKHMFWNPDWAIMIQETYLLRYTRLLDNTYSFQAHWDVFKKLSKYWAIEQVLTNFK